MTQLIAAMCDDGKSVLTMSDRMVSTGDMTLAFEHPHRKAVPISDKSLILTAGTVHEPDLIRDAQDRARGKKRIRDIAHELKEVYQEYRRRYIEDQVLRPLGGLRDFDEFHSKQRMLHDSLVMEINDRIRSYDIGLRLLLAGVDDEGHIVTIDNPGMISSYDKMGYCSVGMGDRHAENVFAWYRYSQATRLNDALYMAFEAKKRAEMAGGVGPTTDALIIDQRGIYEVEPDTLSTLEAVYRERENKGAQRGFDKSITELEIRKRKVEA